MINKLITITLIKSYDDFINSTMIIKIKSIIIAIKVNRNEI